MAMLSLTCNYIYIAFLLRAFPPRYRLPLHPMLLRIHAEADRGRMQSDYLSGSDKPLIPPPFAGVSEDCQSRDMASEDFH